MIQDRGTMKWTALMLPEHVEKIKEWKQEVFAESPKELTEWELEDLQQTMNQAINERLIIILSVWEVSKYVEWIGTIESIIPDTKELVLQNLTKVKRIPLQNIHSARLENYYDSY